MVPGIVPDSLLFLAILWVVAALAITPVLLSSAVRRLVRSWPTDSLLPNYLVAVTAFAATHLLWIAFPIALHGGSLERNVVGWLAGVTLVNLIAWWLLTVIALPLLGFWHPGEGDGIDGRIVLTLGALGYVVVTGVFALFAVIVVIAVGFPG